MLNINYRLLGLLDLVEVDTIQREVKADVNGMTEVLALLSNPNMSRNPAAEGATLGLWYGKLHDSYGRFHDCLMRLADNPKTPIKGEAV